MDEQVKFPTDLSKLADLLRKKGIKSFKGAGIEIELAPELPPSAYRKKQEEANAPIPEEPQYTDEQALFWSSHPIDAPDEVN